MNVVPYSPHRRQYGGSPYLSDIQPSIGGGYDSYSSYGGGLYGGDLYSGRGYYPSGRYMRNTYLDSPYGTFDDLYDDGMYGHFHGDSYIMDGYSHVFPPYGYGGRRRYRSRRDPYICMMM